VSEYVHHTIDGKQWVAADAHRKLIEKHGILANVVKKLLASVNDRHPEKHPHEWRCPFFAELDMLVNEDATHCPRTIDGIRLIPTCGACPEQYDAVDASTGKLLGYLRLRHGKFRVHVPDVSGLVVYEASPKGQGCFDDEERVEYLTQAVQAIKSFTEFSPPTRVAMSSITYEDVSKYVDIRLGLAVSLPDCRDCENEVWNLYANLKKITGTQYVWLRSRIVGRGKSLSGPHLSLDLPDRVLSGER
jgi:hypothetical protein